MRASCDHLHMDIKTRATYYCGANIFFYFFPFLNLVFFWHWGPPACTLSGYFLNMYCVFFDCIKCQGIFWKFDGCMGAIECCSKQRVLILFPSSLKLKKKLKSEFSLVLPKQLDISTSNVFCIVRPRKEDKIIKV